MKAIQGKRTEGGFTLIEILVVILILMVIVAKYLPNVVGVMSQKDAPVILKSLETISTGLARYKGDMGTYPTALEPLWNKDAAPSASVDYWHGPYMKSPSKTVGSSPDMNVAEPSLAGVTYEYVKISTSGGSGNCSNSTQMGAGNASYTEYAIKIAAVPQDTAKRIKDKLGNMACIADSNADTTEVYYVFDEAY